MKAELFLVIATVMLGIALLTYQANKEPQVFDPVLDEPEVEIIDTDKYLELYSVEIFRESSFGFVRANINFGYAIYEVVGSGNAEELKAKLQEHLNAQGYTCGVVLFILNEENREVVDRIV